MSKGIIYTRVSSLEQVKGESLKTQKRICFEYASREGIEAVKHFEERGESAKTTERTQLQEMMKYSLSHQKYINVVIINKIDRLARDSTDYHLLKKEFGKLGITIRSTSEVLEDTPSGRFTEGVLSLQAQFDNEVRTERCRNGIK